MDRVIWPDEGNVHLLLHENLKQFRRRRAVDDQLCRFDQATKCSQHPRQPFYFVTGQEANGEPCP